MPVVRCPVCNNPLSREEQAAGRCPACQRSAANVPSATSPPPEIVAPVAPPTRSPREVERVPSRSDEVVLMTEVAPHAPVPALAWRPVRSGLLLVTVGALLMTAGFLGQARLHQTLPGADAPRWFMVKLRLIGFASGGLWSGGTLLLLGLGLCCRTPAGTAMRGWAVASFCCLGVGFLLYVGGELAVAINEDFLREHGDVAHRVRLGPNGMRMIDRAEQPPPFGAAVLKSLGYTAVSLVILGHLWLGLFLCQVARHLGRMELAISIVAYLLASVAFQILCVYCIVSEAAVPMSRNSVFVVVVSGSGPTWLYLLGASGGVPTWLYLLGALAVVWFVVEVLWTRGVVARAMPRPAQRTS